MGSGKGDSGILGSSCKAGQSDVRNRWTFRKKTAREAMRLAMHKLPIKCKFVKAEGGEQE